MHTFNATVAVACFLSCSPFVQPALLKLLASLGAGFDCASKAELEAALALGLPKDRIIFAHPCKRAADLRFARDAGIQVRPAFLSVTSNTHTVSAGGLVGRCSCQSGGLQRFSLHVLDGCGEC